MRICVKSIGIDEYIPREMRCELPEGATVRKLLLALEERLGSRFREDVLRDGELAPDILILLNGLSLYQPGMGLEAPLHDGDELLLTVMVCGG